VPKQSSNKNYLAHKEQILIFQHFWPIRYPASQKYEYTGLGKQCRMIKEMIEKLRAITVVYDYVMFQHKRFKKKYENSP
jgi:hypothetical protein